MPTLYQPTGSLPKFIYRAGDDKLYVLSSTTVFLPSGESLAIFRISYDSVNKLGKVYFDHAYNAPQIAPYYFNQETYIEIIPDVSALGVDYTLLDKITFLANLRNVMPANVTVECTVENKPGTTNTGGSVSNNISKDKTIEIID